VNSHLRSSPERCTWVCITAPERAAQFQTGLARRSNGIPASTGSVLPKPGPAANASKYPRRRRKKADLPSPSGVSLNAERR
jgi:hypothetical protein